jgi:hypothetical protein
MTTETSPTSQRPVRCAIATALHRSLSDLGHDLLGHAGIGLVLERDHLPAARLPAHGSLERRDRTGALVLHLRDHGSQVERPAHEPERAAGDGRDDRDLVALHERRRTVRVLLVDRVEQAGRFLAEPELRPNVADRRRLELAFAPPGALTQTGEEPDRYAHAA